MVIFFRGKEIDLDKKVDRIISPDNTIIIRIAVDSYKPFDHEDWNIYTCDNGKFMVIGWNKEKCIVIKIGSGSSSIGDYSSGCFPLNDKYWTPHSELKEQVLMEFGLI